MNKQKYLDDIKDIKNIMDRSTKFLSLSGLSGISAGVLALIASYVAYSLVYSEQDDLMYRSLMNETKTKLQLLIIATSTIGLTLITGLYFTAKKAKSNGQKLWDAQAKRFYLSLSIPLVSGGLVCLTFLFNGYAIFVPALTLVFYGLALINASHHSITDIRSLGAIEICLGIVGLCFLGYGLIFWAIGFGILHIIYGIIMHYKYGS